MLKEKNRKEVNMDFEEYKKEVNKNISALFDKANSDERKLLNNMVKTINDICEKEQKLEKENKKIKEDISFCLKSIKQEMEMSTDSRTKQEMLSCYQILNEWSDK